MLNLTVICENAVVLNASFDDYQMLELVLSMYEIRYKESVYSQYEKVQKGNFIIATFSSFTESLRSNE